MDFLPYGGDIARQFQYTPQDVSMTSEPDESANNLWRFLKEASKYTAIGSAIDSFSKLYNTPLREIAINENIPQALKDLLIPPSISQIPEQNSVLREAIGLTPAGSPIDAIFNFLQGENKTTPQIFEEAKMNEALKQPVGKVLLEPLSDNSYRTARNVKDFLWTIPKDSQSYFDFWFNTWKDPMNYDKVEFNNDNFTAFRSPETETNIKNNSLVSWMSSDLQRRVKPMFDAKEAGKEAGREEVLGTNALEQDIQNKDSKEVFDTMVLGMAFDPLNYVPLHGYGKVEKVIDITKMNKGAILKALTSNNIEHRNIVLNSLDYEKGVTNLTDDFISKNLLKDIQPSERAEELVNAFKDTFNQNLSDVQKIELPKIITGLLKRSDDTTILRDTLLNNQDLGLLDQFMSAVIESRLAPEVNIKTIVSKMYNKSLPIKEEIIEEVLGKVKLESDKGQKLTFGLDGIKAGDKIIVPQGLVSEEIVKMIKAKQMFPYSEKPVISTKEEVIELYKDPSNLKNVHIPEKLQFGDEKLDLMVRELREMQFKALHPNYQLLRDSVSIPKGNFIEPELDEIIAIRDAIQRQTINNKGESLEDIKAILSKSNEELSGADTFLKQNLARAKDLEDEYARNIESIDIEIKKIEQSSDTIQSKNEAIRILQKQKNDIKRSYNETTSILRKEFDDKIDYLKSEYVKETPQQIAEEASEAINNPTGTINETLENIRKKRETLRKTGGEEFMLPAYGVITHPANMLTIDSILYGASQRLVTKLFQTADIVLDFINGDTRAVKDLLGKLSDVPEFAKNEINNNYFQDRNILKSIYEKIYQPSIVNGKLDESIFEEKWNEVQKLWTKDGRYSVDQQTNRVKALSQYGDKYAHIKEVEDFKMAGASVLKELESLERNRNAIHGEVNSITGIQDFFNKLGDEVKFKVRNIIIENYGTQRTQWRDIQRFGDTLFLQKKEVPTDSKFINEFLSQLKKDGEFANITGNRLDLESHREELDSIYNRIASNVQDQIKSNVNKEISETLDKMIDRNKKDKITDNMVKFKDLIDNKKNPIFMTIDEMGKMMRKIDDLAGIVHNYDYCYYPRSGGYTYFGGDTHKYEVMLDGERVGVTFDKELSQGKAVNEEKIIRAWKLRDLYNWDGLPYITDNVVVISPSDSYEMILQKLGVKRSKIENLFANNHEVIDEYLMYAHNNREIINQISDIMTSSKTGDRLFNAYEFVFDQIEGIRSQFYPKEINAKLRELLDTSRMEKILKEHGIDFKNTIDIPELKKLKYEIREMSSNWSDPKEGLVSREVEKYNLYNPRGKLYSESLTGWGAKTIDQEMIELMDSVIKEYSLALFDVEMKKILQNQGRIELLYDETGKALVNSDEILRNMEKIGSWEGNREGFSEMTKMINIVRARALGTDLLHNPRLDYVRSMLTGIARLSAFIKIGLNTPKYILDNVLQAYSACKAYGIGSTVDGAYQALDYFVQSKRHPENERVIAIKNILEKLNVGTTQNAGYTQAMTQQALDVGGGIIDESLGIVEKIMRMIDTYPRVTQFFQFADYAKKVKGYDMIEDLIQTMKKDNFVAWDMDSYSPEFKKNLRQCANDITNVQVNYGATTSPPFLPRSLMGLTQFQKFPAMMIQNDIIRLFAGEERKAKLLNVSSLGKFKNEIATLSTGYYVKAVGMALLVGGGWQALEKATGNTGIFKGLMEMSSLNTYPGVSSEEYLNTLYEKAKEKNNTLIADVLNPDGFFRNASRYGLFGAITGHDIGNFAQSNLSFAPIVNLAIPLANAIITQNEKESDKFWDNFLNAPMFVKFIKAMKLKSDVDNDEKGKEFWSGMIRSLNAFHMVPASKIEKPKTLDKMTWGDVTWNTLGMPTIAETQKRELENAMFKADKKEKANQDNLRYLVNKEIGQLNLVDDYKKLIKPEIGDSAEKIEQAMKYNQTIWDSMMSKMANHTTILQSSMNPEWQKQIQKSPIEPYVGRAFLNQSNLFKKYKEEDIEKVLRAELEKLSGSKMGKNPQEKMVLKTAVMAGNKEAKQVLGENKQNLLKMLLDIKKKGISMDDKARKFIKESLQDIDDQ